MRRRPEGRALGLLAPEQTNLLQSGRKRRRRRTTTATKRRRRRQSDGATAAFATLTCGAARLFSNSLRRNKSAWLAGANACSPKRLSESRMVTTAAAAAAAARKRRSSCALPPPLLRLLSSSSSSSSSSSRSSSSAPSQPTCCSVSERVFGANEQQTIEARSRLVFFANVAAAPAAAGDAPPCRQADRQTGRHEGEQTHCDFHPCCVSVFLSLANSHVCSARGSHVGRQNNTRLSRFLSICLARRRRRRRSPLAQENRHHHRQSCRCRSVTLGRAFVPVFVC